MLTTTADDPLGKADSKVGVSLQLMLLTVSGLSTLPLHY